LLNIKTNVAGFSINDSEELGLIVLMARKHMRGNGTGLKGKMTQKDTATGAGVSQAHISRVETGDVGEIQKLIKLLDFLGLRMVIVKKKE